MDVFLISYEFCFSTFSGNGILARSLVLSLLQQGCHVTVWCARPPLDSDSDNSKDHLIQVPEVSQEERDRLRIIYTTKSSRDLWYCLDDQSAWSEFNWESLSAVFKKHALEAMTAAAAVLVVDWTGHHAWKTTPYCNPNGYKYEFQGKKLVYMNFRVFSSGVKDEKKRKWYDDKERSAVQQADLVIALSEKDKASLLSMQTQSPRKPASIQVLVPPLRKDLEELAIQAAKSGQPTAHFLQYMPQEASKALVHLGDTNRPSKCFVTCCVRLSPEKNTLRFVRFVQKLKPLFIQRNWIPLLAGSSSDTAYSEQVKAELKSTWKDAVIVESFLSPESLAAVFSCSVLNFHPASYDAYGMTIIEAAAMGVPSVVVAGKSVGAAKQVRNGASIEVDIADFLDSDQIGDEAIRKIAEKLQDREGLVSTGVEARKRALAWDEKAYGVAVLKNIQDLI